MLTQVFSKLLHMSFAAAWLALAVVLLRILLRKAPRRVILLLWALVAVRLVCPVSIESPLSLVPRPETVVQTVQTAAETPAAPRQDFSRKIRVYAHMFLRSGRRRSRTALSEVVNNLIMP